MCLVDPLLESEEVEGSMGQSNRLRWSGGRGECSDRSVMKGKAVPGQGNYGSGRQSSLGGKKGKTQDWVAGWESRRFRCCYGERGERANKENKNSRVVLTTGAHEFVWQQSG